jgi:probable aminopeptidase NPEPL1
VLADGVAYACKHLSPGLIVDMATLTGAQLVATGKRHAAIVANSAELESAAITAGLASGDLVHPLPYAPEFFRSEFASKVADMRNSVKDRSNAQSSCAANFVAEHLSADYDGGWLHVDMAGPAWIGDRGTGYGVALLLSLLQQPV